MKRIDSFPKEFDELLQAIIEENVANFTGCHSYLLIDGVFDETCYGKLKKSGVFNFVPLYAGLPGADEECLGLSPLLVEYSPTHRQFSMQLLKRFNGQPAISVIATPENLNELATRLLPWCVIDANDYTLALALADTRVLPHLFSVMTAEQVKEIAGPAFRWCYLARNAVWCDLQVPVVPHRCSDVVRLNDEQCGTLIDCSEADNILFKLNASSTTMLGEISPSEAHAEATFWLSCANDAKLENINERLRLCEFGLNNPDLKRDHRILHWKNNPLPGKTLEELRQYWGI